MDFNTVNLCYLCFLSHVHIIFNAWLVNSIVIQCHISKLNTTQVVSVPNHICNLMDLRLICHIRNRLKCWNLHDWWSFQSGWFKQLCVWLLINLEIYFVYVFNYRFIHRRRCLLVVRSDIRNSSAGCLMFFVPLIKKSKWLL